MPTTVGTLPRSELLRALDPAVHAARLACDRYVLPPQYLQLRLKLGFVVVGNTPETHRNVTRHVGDAGTYFDKRYVAVHRLGLALHEQRDGLVYASALAPDGRTTTPVSIGIRPEYLAGRLTIARIDDIQPGELVNPYELLDATWPPREHPPESPAIQQPGEHFGLAA